MDEIINNFKKSGIGRNGFTMIEALIVIGIIVLFSGIILANSGGQNDSLRLRTTVQELANDLRRVQNFAVSTRVSGTEIPSGGYGIRFNKSAGNYIIFTDANNTPNRVFDAGEQIETKTLYSNIEIDSITLSSSGSADYLDVIFVPPDPVTYINESKVYDLYATVVFKIKGKNCPQSCRSITIKTSGVIE